MREPEYLRQEQNDRPSVVPGIRPWRQARSCVTRCKTSGSSPMHPPASLTLDLHSKRPKEPERPVAQRPPRNHHTSATSSVPIPITRTLTPSVRNCPQAAKISCP